MAHAPDAWFIRPAGGGRQRVIVYLHGRNSEPHEHCRQLAAQVLEIRVVGFDDVVGHESHSSIGTARAVPAMA